MLSLTSESRILIFCSSCFLLVAISRFIFSSFKFSCSCFCWSSCLMCCNSFLSHTANSISVATSSEIKLYHFVLLNIVALQDLQWHSSSVVLWYSHQHQYTLHSFSAFLEHETLHFNHVQELDHAAWRWMIDFCVSHTLIRYENYLNCWEVQRLAATAAV